MEIKSEEVVRGMTRVAIINRLEDLQAQLRRLGSNWVDGYPNSSGTAGARGRLTHVSEILDPLPIDAFTTRDDGLNTYPGFLRAISSQWSGLEVGEFTLMASFDLATYSRLSDALSGNRGSAAMDDALCSLTIVIAERPTT